MTSEPPSSQPRNTRPRRRRIGVLAVVGLIAAAGVIALVVALRPAPLLSSSPPPAATVDVSPERLRPVSDFAGIADPALRSVAMFEEAGRVIQSPRCMNCHPVTDRPTQTETMQPHLPSVVRGSDGGGPAALRCIACHHDENDVASGVPGDPHWALAPIEMGWQGRSLGEICRQIQDPARGGMEREALLHHMAEDHLVGWAWRPGGGRTPAPGTQEEFGALITAWLETGGRCPQ